MTPFRRRSTLTYSALTYFALKYSLSSVSYTHLTLPTKA